MIEKILFPVDFSPLLGGRTLSLSVICPILPTA